ncbi:alpha-D-ribose 1-methylphosphonate 5-triphosphate synthase subunit PhnG [Williamsia sterculiae]|uniref:Alpha-D-ribose 1-methylphosphonate 5-triphosphate synthase subunit PhnG n=1 Tax=Williamsia sterculiae TaxID=1344003 RepID=A0A1N7FJ77_9NOCA|nr:alpha-D-ribose 1-methylphosphonate 5-triphosphate synthase subunit PhnG [Williamsia sterculiae]
MTASTPTDPVVPPDVAARQQWMRTLAEAGSAELIGAWERWEPKPEVRHIRGPEAGLVMVRGRADAGGVRFNLGEATVTRATVRLHGAPVGSDVIGSSYVLGTDLDHAELAAIFDGMLADPVVRERVLDEVVTPLERRQRQHDESRQAEARSTLVDFFTVAREHE